MAAPNERRRKLLRRVVELRQRNWTVILENVHDQHNLAAVMRSCDAVGIQELFLLQTDPGLKEKNIKLGKKTSGGTRKWLDVHYYQDRAACFEHVGSVVDYIYATHLGESAVSLHELDFRRSIGLLFGNEHDGVTAETLAYTDGNFLIPMYGIVESLNISVACAVSLFEGLRQREAVGMYQDPPTSPEQREALFQTYLQRHEHGQPEELKLYK
ncbi:MAG: TrmH family RNA methyltransferase [Bacteroidota bacterium]